MLKILRDLHVYYHQNATFHVFFLGGGGNWNGNLSTKRRFFHKKKHVSNSTNSTHTLGKEGHGGLVGTWKYFHCFGEVRGGKVLNTANI